MSTPAPRIQQAQWAPATGVQTQTQQGPAVLPNLPSGTLRLRAEPEERRHIQWAEDVVDNEGMGKKSSKVCCIYHKPTEVGESSDEDSSDSSSDSDSEPDNSTARPGGRMTRRHHHHDGDHGERPHGEGPSGEGCNEKPKKSRRRSPNAYEKQPQYKKKDGDTK